jgi:hypothetical protein
VAWAATGLRLGGEGKRIGPETAQTKEGSIFFPKVFSIFQIHFAILETIKNSNFSGVFQNNHGPSLHIEAP